MEKILEEKWAKVTPFAVLCREFVTYQNCTLSCTHA